MSDLPHGLFSALLLDGRGGARALAPEELAPGAALERPLWLHFDLSHAEAQTWIREESGLEAVACEALLTAESRPRVTSLPGGALMAFRGVNLNPGAEPDDMIGIRIWVDGDRVLSTLRRELRSVDDVEASLLAGEGPSTPMELIVALLDRLSSRMTDVVENLEERVGDLEAEVLEQGRNETRFALSELRRQLIALRRYIGPQREAVGTLLSLKVPGLDDDLRLVLRETSDRMIRIVEDLEAVRERAAVTQEELVGRIAEQQNVRMYVLSVVAAIFLPLGFLTGLLGINVGGIPGSDSPLGFIVFLAILTVIVIAEIWYFRARKWF